MLTIALVFLAALRVTPVSAPAAERPGRAAPPRASQALAWFRRTAGDSVYARSWQFHFGYANCLDATAHETNERRGRIGPTVSSSLDRIALCRTAIAELQVADRLAPGDSARAVVRASLGEIFETWGFPVDAFGCYALALEADSTNAKAREGRWRTAVRLQDREIQTPEPALVHPVSPKR